MTPKTHRSADDSLAEQVAELAWRAMIAEVELSPKPGLVDRHSNGAHKDMTLEDFYLSANAIYPWLADFVRYGATSAGLPETSVLPGLRQTGLACEADMFRATGGVNTHKGSIFSLGLLCAAVGRLHEHRLPLTSESICSTAAAFCRGLTARELQSGNLQGTAGQRLYLTLGLTGARGQAETGYPLVRNLALPHVQKLRSLRLPSGRVWLDTLLVLMAYNGDTNVASRGGLQGLLWIQQRARTLLHHGCVRQDEDMRALHEFNRQCIARNLSPGGSADLLIVTLFLDELSRLTER
ncbi:triphosphoribosyl-dephospho-CoA synthase CitG [Enterobacteriaceae bacterium C34A]